MERAQRVRAYHAGFVGKMKRPAEAGHAAPSADIAVSRCQPGIRSPLAVDGSHAFGATRPGPGLKNSAVRYFGSSPKI